MKKAKILLASIAVVGILGGTFAFKAAKRGTKTYYTTTIANAVPPTTNTIPFAIVTATTTAPLRYWTTVPNVAASNLNRVATDAL